MASSLVSPSSEALAINLVAAIVSFLFMALLFRVAWRISEDRIWRFNSFANVTKADWCSRINSTVHAAVACTLVVVCLVTMTFDSATLVPTGSTTLLEVTFSISIGYFLFDLAIIVWWVLPMWTVFVVHHLVALTPYVITQFFYVCHSGEYVLLLFLLVELSTLPLNAMAFLEDLGLQRTKTHLLTHCGMYVTWFLCRVLLPAYLLFVIWTKVVQQYTREETCLLPSMICAHMIALFCIGVFCFVLTPELFRRLRHGDKDEPPRPDDICSYSGRGIGMSATIEVGGGAAGGAYHDLESAGGIPDGPHPIHPDHNGVDYVTSDDDKHHRDTNTRSTGKSHDGKIIVGEFREDLLLGQHDEDDGAPEQSDEASRTTS